MVSAEPWVWFWQGLGSGMGKHNSLCVCTNLRGIGNKQQAAIQEAYGFHGNSFRILDARVATMLNGPEFAGHRPFLGGPKLAVALG